jgi:diguanylate cyclase (GGDEF)-like protein/PAS domain S-box-containing protein
VLDLEGRIVLVNPAAMGLLDYGRDEIIGRHIHEITSTDILTESFTGEIKRKRMVKVELKYKSKAGEEIPVSLSVSELKDDKKNTVGYVCVAKDIRELEKLINQIEVARKKLERLAVTDHLTGLHNRRYLMVKIKEERLRAKRYGSVFSVAIIDLDRFKEINDRYGHSEGDRVLRTLAGEIQSKVRTTDTVARYGGDEFVIVLPETGKGDALRMAERVRKSIRSDKLPEEYRFVTASLGLATFSPGKKEIDEDELLRLADHALYEAKRMGRDRTLHSDNL